MTKREARAMVTKLGSRAKSSKKLTGETEPKQEISPVKLLEQSIEKQRIHAPQIGYGLHGQRKQTRP